MIQTVQQTVATRFPRLSGKRVLVAVSGGADSTALALCLCELGCEMALAHVHHGIRGRAATADARFVRTLAEKWGVPFFLGQFDVPAEAKQTGESMEMAARRVRREFLQVTAKAQNIRWIATGHTADDQAETILMRVIRGTGITGLAGIPYARKQGAVTWIRPLRDATRDQITAYLQERKQRWREDKTNAEDFAMRNRVRHEILPLLEKRLNPSVRKALLRLGDIAAAEDQVMAALTKQAGDSEKQPLAIQRRLALKQLRQNGVPEADIGFDAVEKSFHTMETFFPYHGKPAKKFSIPWKNSARPKGVVKIPQIAAELHVRKGRGFVRDVNEVCLSAKAVGGRDLVFRSWRAGDRMKPLGMNGSKKLSDIFTDLKVPCIERNAWVVVECGGEIAALLGWRVARGFAVSGPEAASLRIRLSTTKQIGMAAGQRMGSALKS